MSYSKTRKILGICLVILLLFAALDNFVFHTDRTVKEVAISFAEAVCPVILSYLVLYISGNDKKKK